MSERITRLTPLMSDVELTRFRAKYVPVPYCGCWLWDAAASGSGYGIMCVGGANHRAHRLSYRYFVGPIPAGRILLHSCDVPACVNPDHLRPGTHEDNMVDAALKGRNASQRRPWIRRGTRNGRSKLTPESVRAIKRRLLAGHSKAAIASDYGVTDVLVGLISRGRAWSHVVPDDFGDDDIPF